MIDLRSILESYANCLNSRSTFKAVLLDKYPQEKRMINILTSIYECGLVHELKSRASINILERTRYITRLEAEYGYVTKYIEEGLSIWMHALGVELTCNNFMQSPLPPRRLQDVYLVIDTSGGMVGDRIGALNSAIENLITRLNAIEDSYDISIRLQILQFCFGATWQSPCLIKASEYLFSDLLAGGLCDLGAAYGALDRQLAQNYNGFNSALYQPIIALFLLRDPTDNYLCAFDKLKHNPWFVHSKRVAFAMSQDTNREILSAFTGNKSVIFNASELHVLIDMGSWFCASD